MKFECERDIMDYIKSAGNKVYRILVYHRIRE